MCTYSTFMYMRGTLKADHWRLPTGTPNCHIVAGVKPPEEAKSFEVLPLGFCSESRTNSPHFSSTWSVLNQRVFVFVGGYAKMDLMNSFRASGFLYSFCMQ